jgi:hypothetical protein
MTTNKWGSLASFLLAVSFIVAPSIYLAGNLRDALGVFSYSLADFLYGPVLSTSLITVTYVLREKIGQGAKRRMDLALLFAVLAAVGLAGVAFIRASNRQFHLIHPELNLENDVTVLTVWGTLVAGMSGFGFHFLGWNFILLGSAGWTSKIFPNVLNVLYILAGVLSLFVYLSPNFDLPIFLPAAIICIWQGILLWKSESI